MIEFCVFQGSGDIPLMDGKSAKGVTCKITQLFF